MNNQSRTEEAYQRLLNAENDPITAGLVQSYLKRQQATSAQIPPSISQQPKGMHDISTPLTSDGQGLHNHSLQYSAHQLIP